MFKDLVSNFASIGCDITYLKRENNRRTGTSSEQLTASTNKPQVKLRSVSCAAKLQNTIVVTLIILIQVALSVFVCHV